MENNKRKLVAAMVLAVLAIGAVGVGFHNITKAEARINTVNRY